jgi:hypothetical protein
LQSKIDLFIENWVNTDETDQAVLQQSPACFGVTDVFLTESKEKRGYRVTVARNHLESRSMKRGQVFLSLFAVLIAVVLLQGCNETNALPGADAKSATPAEPPKNLESTVKKKTRGNIPTTNRGMPKAAPAE